MNIVVDKPTLQCKSKKDRLQKNFTIVNKHFSLYERVFAVMVAHQCVLGIYPMKLFHLEHFFVHIVFVYICEVFLESIVLTRTV